LDKTISYCAAQFNQVAAPRLGERMRLGVDMADVRLCETLTLGADEVTFAVYPSLADRVVFVTGGASGIGADIVEAFAGQRARVAFVDLQKDAGDALCERIAARGEPRPLSLQSDVTDIPALQAAIAHVRAELGPIGVLVNNAANDRRHKIDEVSVEFWDHAQDVNLRHHFFCAQAVAPQMRELGGGSIINMSSTSWRFGAAEMPAYATAKAAVLGLTRALARAFGPDNIRVNAIEPGAVMTERQRELWYKTDQSVKEMVDRQLLGRVLLGEEIARMILFLAADDSRMITKQSFLVDAGLR
jgi:NAD(P)-dependent dehydrogenase (short-subunit alcohol dehydrogenase family)